MSTDTQAARAMIEADYRVEHGIIRSPGKFEAEPVYVPHFYNLWLDGGADDEETSGDDDGAGTLVFNLTDDDRRDWPELGNARVLRLCQDSYGFVHSEVR